MLVLTERMALSTDGDQLILLKRLDVKAASGGVLGKYADIRHAINNRSNDVATKLLFNFHTDGWVLAQKSGKAVG
ncbi:hypothetical protein CTTA_2309 [Comamonas testosteroni]|uniref:Uncharacterized protein n=1 Tax=Comamonas testosteroni TaxID=285 RepID=A0A5A7MEJ5_COMTE|nr:hypothetical protein CTTA_2309 [Comamonas testosteroni]